MSPSPSAASLSYMSSSGCSECAASSIAAWRSPTSAKRTGIVATVKSSGSTSASSSQLTGAETGGAGLGGDAHRVGVVGAGLGVEVDPQLVGMVDVGASNRPRMKGDRAHLRRPADHRDLGGADLVGVAPGGELDPRGLDVIGSPARDPLLKEGVAAALLARRDDD